MCKIDVYCNGYFIKICNHYFIHTKHHSALNNVNVTLGYILLEEAS